MEHIKKNIQKATQRRKEYSISLINTQIVKLGTKTYLKPTNGTLTKQGIADSIKRLASNFKKLDDSFYSILAERAKKNGFDDEMLINAVDNVIDNFIYNEPKVADVLKLNTNVQLFNYHEIVNMNDKMNRKAFEYYRPIKVPGLDKPMYASLVDINKHGLEIVKPKEL